MAAPAIVGLERAEYRIELPVHSFGSDLAEAMVAASPCTLQHAFALQALWYGECEKALQQLAVLAETYHLEVQITGHDVRVTGPQLCLDLFEFLTRIVPEDDA